MSSLSIQVELGQTLQDSTIFSRLHSFLGICPQSTIKGLKLVRVISSKSVFKKLSKSAAIPRRVITVYGLEASQECIPSSVCTAVVQLVVPAVSSAGPFFLVAFELPGSSECIDSHLSLPCVQEGWPLPAACAGFQSTQSLHSFKVAFQGPRAGRSKALGVTEHAKIASRHGKS